MDGHGETFEEFGEAFNRIKAAYVCQNAGLWRPGERSGGNWCGIAEKTEVNAVWDHFIPIGNRLDTHSSENGIGWDDDAIGKATEETFGGGVPARVVLERVDGLNVDAFMTE